MDNAFGRDGRLVLGESAASEGVKNRYFHAADIAVDGQGRLLVFGSQLDNAHTVFGEGSVPFLSETNAIVFRFNGRGRRDSGFGGGKGFVRSGFGITSPYSAEVPLVSAMAGAVDSSGRPVLVAGASKPASGCYGHSGPITQPEAIVRLTRSGMLDTTFASGGVGLAEGTAARPGLQISRDDGLIASLGRAGGGQASCQSGTTLYRFGPDGTRVSGFGSEGVRFLPHFALSDLTPSGMTVIGAGRGRNLLLAKLRANGDRDKTFGDHGLAIVKPPFSSAGQVGPVAVDARGRIILAGLLEPSKIQSGGRSRSAFVVARLLPDGKPDRSFGNRGWLATRFPGSLRVGSVEGALDRKGRLVLAGATEARNNSYGGFVVARYLLGH